MTTEQITTVIIDEMKSMRAREVTANDRFRLGKIIGMVRAFQLAGMLTTDEAYQIYFDICDECL